MNIPDKHRWRNYFQRTLELDSRQLPVLPKPCADCAVECGLYQDISDALRDQDEEIKAAFSRSWFCHNNPQAACRGNYNNVYNK